MKCGIIGLPNVGKSTLFNCLTSLKAPAENYPFCTVEPNVGRVSVPDVRLQELSQVFHSEKVIPASLEFVDIAGLIQGAHKGEGLGNHFLSHIRDVHALLHVVRVFKATHIAHTEQSIDPLRDIQLIDTELLLADVASLEKKQQKLLKAAKGVSNKSAQIELSLVEKLIHWLLKEEKPAREYCPQSNEVSYFHSLRLLTAKPVLYVCNIDDDNSENSKDIKLLCDRYSEHSVLTICAQAEAISTQSLKSFDPVAVSVNEQISKSSHDLLVARAPSGLARLIQKAYALLGLITFFTAGKTETRAWTISQGTTARAAAGKIHSDFEKKFIKAEVYSFIHMRKFQSVDALRQAGKYRLEGQNYVVQDGDVILFKFNR